MRRVVVCLSALRIAIGFRTCAIQVTYILLAQTQVSRHVGHVRAEEEPHPKPEEGHHSGDGVEEVAWKEVPIDIILHVPFGVVTL